MVMPILYWMLECRRCGSRRVVRDFYLEIPGMPLSGVVDGGRPLPERYGCLAGCPDTPEVLASVFSPDDAEMRLHTPYVLRPMDARQRREWARLIAQGDARGPIDRARAAVVRWLRS